MTEKRWLISQADLPLARELSQKTGLSLLLCTVLSARGVKSPAEVCALLDTSVDTLIDPFALSGIREAVDTIRDAIAHRQRIAVYGDYDVDGVTATCLLIDCLRTLGADCLYYIPDRLTEGYGVHPDALCKLRDAGVDLIITVDTGVTAVEEIALAYSLGMRVVITDHHECAGAVPDAEAVVDPKLPGCTYPFRELAGVGVAFKLVCALLGDTHTALERYAELVCLGTVADVMPLRGESRVIVNYGLRKLAYTRSVGLRALLRESGVLSGKRPLSATSLSFALAPRINAAGRFGLASRAVELFLTDDDTLAQTIAAELSEINRQRQGTENDMLREALDVLESACDPVRDRAFVLWHEGWHHGILGIVASRLTDRFSRPVILLSVDGDTAKGSGRSIPGFNLYNALSHIPTRQFGGHELAAGLTLDTADLERFRDDFCAYAAENLSEEDCVPCIDVDCEITPKLLTLDAVASLSRLEPTGMGNPEPVFCLRDLRISQLAAIGNNRHTRLFLEGDGCRLPCVYFGRNPDELGLLDGDMVDVVCGAQVNDFRGRAVQLILKDIRRTEVERKQDNETRGLYERFRSGDTLTESERRKLRPEREELVSVWQYVAVRAKTKALTEDAAKLYREVRAAYQTPTTLGRLYIALDVFAELGLLRQERHGGRVTLEPQREVKADLAESQILAQLT
ncbi:MAG: single-stranded-DNA-specific exonuclease RecJ [Clostridiales bacterium]|nr:single-stranded-DNA-specific exonuclease RecJ [Clostridiales bacterium]